MGVFYYFHEIYVIFPLLVWTNTLLIGQLYVCLECEVTGIGEPIRYLPRFNFLERE